MMIKSGEALEPVPVQRDRPRGVPRLDRRRGETDGGPAFDVLGRLVAEFAHEARNPLASILASLEAWDAEPEEGWELYRPRIRREAERLTLLMNDVLELARPPRRRWKALSVRLLVEEVIGSAGPAAQAAGVALEAVIAPGATLVEGDPVALQRAVGNLLDNALHHTPRGGAVRVAVRRQGACVAIAVEDSGPGFAAAEIDRVFEPFFSGRRGGSGLGLAIVRKVIAEHRGRVEVSNGADRGAVVSIVLPAAEAAG